VDVIDHDDQRLFGREGLEQTAERPERLLGGAGGGSPAQRAGDPAGDQRRIRGSHKHTVESTLRIWTGDLADNLCQRPVRDAFAVRQATARHHPGAATHRTSQLPSQSGLADARCTGDRAEPTGALGDGTLKLVLERGQFCLPIAGAGFEPATSGL